MIDNNPWLLLDEYYNMFDVPRLREVFNVLKSHRETYWSVTEKNKFTHLDHIKQNKKYYDLHEKEIKDIVVDDPNEQNTDVFLIGQQDNPLHSRYKLIGDHKNIKEVVSGKKYLQKVGTKIINNLNIKDFIIAYDVNYIYSMPNAKISWHYDSVPTVPDRLLYSENIRCTPSVITVNLNERIDYRSPTRFKYNDYNYKLDYYKVALLNTSVLHCVDATPNERLTLRICLYGKPFEEIKEKLINEKTR